MDTKRFAVILSVAVLFLSAFVAVAESVSEAVDDARITARIETTFMLNRELSSFNINTTTSKGVVTLSGSVSDEVQKGLAEDIAKDVPGVKKVVSNLVVMDQPAQHLPKRSWGQLVEDRTTSALIRSRLLYHKKLDGLKIDVKCVNGAVTLSGVAASEEQKKRIGEIAQDTRGVTEVVNNLTVHANAKMDPISKIGHKMSDEWIQKRVQTALFINRHISLRDLNIVVKDGLCILGGTVSTDEQKQLAESVAASVYGVQTVENNILVQHYVPPPRTMEPIEAPSDAPAKK